MKKALLIFMLTVATTFAYSQSFTSISVDSIIVTVDTNDLKGDTIYMDTVVKSITVEITNNDAITFPGAVAGDLGTAIVFEVELDGTKFPAPGGGSGLNWNVTIPEDFEPGETLTLIMNQLWTPSESIGYHDLTVRLTTAIDQNEPGNPYINSDANLERTQQYYFDAPLSFGGPGQSIFNAVYVHQDELIIETESLSGNVDLEVVAITGQVMHSERLSNHPGSMIRTIDISNLNSGIYIISLKNDKGYQYAQKVYVP
jgi:hypothetical protein